MRLLRGDLQRFATDTSDVREMDRRAIQDYDVPAAVLMENAGSAAAELAMEMLQPGANALVVAGAGNNAGDGFVIARHLANHGIRISILASRDPARYTAETAANLRTLLAMDVPVATWNPKAARLPDNCGLIIDSLLGTGLVGDLLPPYPAIINFINSAGAPVLSVDLPSGLDGDTGEVHTLSVKAHKTVTFALPKKGLFLAQGPSYAGEVVLADIGIPFPLYPGGESPWKP